MYDFQEMIYVFKELADLVEEIKEHDSDNYKGYPDSNLETISRFIRTQIERG